MCLYVCVSYVCVGELWCIVYMCGSEVYSMYTCGLWCVHCLGEHLRQVPVLNEEVRMLCGKRERRALWG